jgi:glutamate-5-semialdehyde dehydrogenase
MTEHLLPTLAVRTVLTLATAIPYISEHGSHHTDCIVTKVTLNQQHVRARRRLGQHTVNASTRFADSFRCGFDAEVGSRLGGSTRGGLLEWRGS